jgi:RNA polymerase sigma factor (sigma-70 family)
LTNVQFNDIAKEYGPRLYRFAFKMLCDSASAKDMTQDALMKLWENRDNVNFSKVKSWLFTTTYRLCLKRIEESRKYTLEDCMPDSGVNELPPPDLKAIITESLNLLGDTQRSVLLLRDYEGYDYSEIAEIVGVTESQARLHLFRARQKIKAYLKDIEYVI